MFWRYQTNIKKSRHQKTCMTRFLAYGANIPAPQECAKIGQKKTKRLDNAPLRHFWRRIYLAEKSMEQQEKAEIFIVIMSLETAFLT